MKRLLTLILFTLISVSAFAQSTGYLRNDTTKITNSSKTATLVYETATKGHGYYLKDVGNGKLAFIAIDSTSLPDIYAHKYQTYTRHQVDSMRALKQNLLVYDSYPIQNSTNIVNSGNLYTALQAYVPNSRTLTINGTAYPLSSNQTINVTPNYTATNPLVISGSNISINQSSPSQGGYLSSTDYARFNGKQDVLLFDTIPYSGSIKPVTSNGIYQSIKNFTSKSYVDSIANTKVKYTDTAAAFNNLVHINGNQQINGTLALHKTFYYPTADFGQAFTIFDNGIPLSDKRVLAMGKDSSGSYLRLMNDSTDFNLKGFHGGNIVTVHQDGRIKGVDPIEDLDLVTKRFLIGYATTSSLSNYVPISSANQPNGYFKLDASGNAVLRSGYMDIGPAEYYGGALEVGGTYPGAGAGGFQNNSPTGRAIYLIGGAAGYHNTDIYDYTGTNLVGFIAGTKNLSSTDTLALANVKYVNNVLTTLTTFYTDAVNSGSIETDLYSYTVPANTIQANGKRIEAKYSVNILGTGGNKYLRAYFAGTSLNLTTSSAAANATMTVTIIRTGTTTARALVTINFDNTAMRVTETDLTGLDFTTANILKITGMADTGTGGEITAKFGTIELK